MKEREAYGVKFVVSGETFDEYKGTLQDQLEEKDKEIDRLNNIINELEEWLDEFYKSNRKWYNTELSNHDREYYKEYYINTEAMLVKFDKKLKELKEEGNDE